METQYQKDVDNLTGALSPHTPAYWKDTSSTTGNPWNLGAQPLRLDLASGLYTTSFDSNAAPSGTLEGPSTFGVLGTLGPNASTWNPSVAFGSRKSRKGRKGEKSRKGHKSRKGKKSKKSRKGRKLRKSKKSKKGHKGSRRFGSCTTCPNALQTNLGFGEKIY
jgi:hypothetical protein